MLSLFLPFLPLPSPPLPSPPLPSSSPPLSSPLSPPFPFNPSTDYNGLDGRLGTEVSGCDVLDDFEAEAKEIRDNGNTFFVYTHALHVCRMAGCSSKEADMMDEEKMPLYSCLALVDQLLRVPLEQRLHDVSVGWDGNSCILACQISTE